MIYPQQPAGRLRLSPASQACILIAAAMAMFIVALKAPLWIWQIADSDEALRSVADWVYYNVSFLSASYFNVGFVRRALGGTISRLLSSDPVHGALLFHIVSTLLLIVPLTILQRGLLRT